MSKALFAGECQRAAGSMVQLVKRLMKDLNETWFDRGYNSGGANAFVDGDLTSFGITAVQLADFINFCGQVNTLLDNGEPFQADWLKTLNLVRTDV